MCTARALSQTKLGPLSVRCAHHAHTVRCHDARSKTSRTHSQPSRDAHICLLVFSIVSRSHLPEGSGNRASLALSLLLAGRLVTERDRHCLLVIWHGHCRSSLAPHVSALSSASKCSVQQTTFLAGSRSCTAARGTESFKVFYRLESQAGCCRVRAPFRRMRGTLVPRPQPLGALINIRRPPDQ